MEEIRRASLGQPIDLLGPELYTYWQDTIDDEDTKRKDHEELLDACSSLVHDSLKLKRRSQLRTHHVLEMDNETWIWSSEMKRVRGRSAPYPMALTGYSKQINHANQRVRSRLPVGVCRFRRCVSTSHIQRYGSAGSLHADGRDILRTSFAPEISISACGSHCSQEEGEQSVPQLKISPWSSATSLPPKCMFRVDKVSPPRVQRTDSTCTTGNTPLRRTKSLSVHRYTVDKVAASDKANQDSAESARRKSDVALPSLPSLKGTIKNAVVMARAVDKARAKFVGTLGRSGKYLTGKSSQEHSTTQASLYASTNSSCSDFSQDSEHARGDAWQGSIERYTPYFATSQNNLAVLDHSFSTVRSLDSVHVPRHSADAKHLRAHSTDAGLASYSPSSTALYSSHPHGHVAGNTADAALSPSCSTPCSLSNSDSVAAVGRRRRACQQTYDGGNQDDSAAKLGWKGEIKLLLRT
eukprot:scpid66463/ scgid34189/ 